jgi:hypothetical protein
MIYIYNNYKSAYYRVFFDLDMQRLLTLLLIVALTEYTMGENVCSNSSGMGKGHDMRGKVAVLTGGNNFCPCQGECAPVCGHSQETLASLCRPRKRWPRLGPPSTSQRTVRCFYNDAGSRSSFRFTASLLEASNSLLTRLWMPGSWRCSGKEHLATDRQS